MTFRCVLSGSSNWYHATIPGFAFTEYNIGKVDFQESMFAIGKKWSAGTGFIIVEVRVYYS